MADLQEQEFKRLGLDFQSLWGRRLQLIDCQNLFCEVDKFARVAHPQIVGRTGRTRIKQKFEPTLTPIEFYLSAEMEVEREKILAGPDTPLGGINAAKADIAG